MATVTGIRGSAFLIAAFRVGEGKSAEPLYYDDVARMYLGRDVLIRAEEVARPSPFVEEMVRLRTRHFDDALASVVSQGYRQILVLDSAWTPARSVSGGRASGPLRYTTRRPSVPSRKSVYKPA
ncbi:class I SAM-dependent methyltransferase [Tautonia plasticadhaerens]|uniref:Uncharacterized protein n=1 Tax=Tautonia plasticadhaerens TaxID=2527974 RepID=A0A518H6E3_9BACT|nr:hypothetical protein [Tautonia plasticadhaerens]QDV36409.1 hypothetical protein ElP_43330 [Tautonia plasticadhaerens]